MASIGVQNRIAGAVLVSHHFLDRPTSLFDLFSALAIRKCGCLLEMQVTPQRGQAELMLDAVDHLFLVIFGHPE